MHCYFTIGFLFCVFFWCFFCFVFYWGGGRFFSVVVWGIYIYIFLFFGGGGLGCFFCVPTMFLFFFCRWVYVGVLLYILDIHVYVACMQMSCGENVIYYL